MPLVTSLKNMPAVRREAHRHRHLHAIHDRRHLDVGRDAATGVGRLCSLVSGVSIVAHGRRRRGRPLGLRGGVGLRRRRAVGDAGGVGVQARAAPRGRWRARGLVLSSGTRAPRSTRDAPDGRPERARQAGAPRSIGDRFTAGLRNLRLGRLGQQALQQWQRLLDGSPAMAQRVLLVDSKLAHGAAEAAHHEDRIVAEAVGAGRFARHHAPAGAGAMVQFGRQASAIASTEMYWQPRRLGCSATVSMIAGS